MDFDEKMEGNLRTFVHKYDIKKKDVWEVESGEIFVIVDVNSSRILGWSEGYGYAVWCGLGPVKEAQGSPFILKKRITSRLCIGCSPWNDNYGCDNFVCRRDGTMIEGE